MPELPEVETIKNDLKKKILNKKILKIEIKDKKIVKNSPRLFLNLLKNAEFKNIQRIGKLLIFILKDKKFLLIHLKMTGQLIYQGKNELIAGGHQNSNLESPIVAEDKPGISNLENKHTRVVFTFIDKTKLFYNDLRKFGYLKIVDEKKLKLIKEKFGPEPLTKNFTLNNLKKALKNKRINIKAFLLNQKNIAGIGNIYADEILFASKIKPERSVAKLTKKEIENIYKNTEITIKKAIKWRGTTFSNYVDGQGKRGNFTKLLKVYGRDNEKCLVCKNKINKIKLNGRGTHYCPICQK